MVYIRSPEIIIGSFYPLTNVSPFSFRLSPRKPALYLLSNSASSALKKTTLVRSHSIYLPLTYFIIHLLQIVGFPSFYD